MPLPNFLTTKSILGRLGLLMGAIVILAIVSIMVSTIFTELAAGKARAINLAGSLRMQAYAIEAGLGRPAVDAEAGVAATAKSIAAFAARLDNPALQAGLNPELARPLHERYLRVRDRWSQEIRPGAEAAAVNPQARGSFALALDSFVADIDTLVQLMEQDLEGKIQWAAPGARRVAVRHRGGGAGHHVHHAHASARPPAELARLRPRRARGGVPHPRRTYRRR